MSDTDQIICDITDKTNDCCDTWSSRPPDSFSIVAAALQIGLLQEIKDLLVEIRNKLPFGP